MACGPVGVSALTPLKVDRSVNPTIPDSVQKEEPQVAGKPPAWKTWDKGQGFGTSRIDDPI